MRPAHPTERTVGMEYYVSDADGVGGRLRERDGDFRVRERERFDTQPVDADPDAYPHLVLRATLRGWDTNDFAARLSDALGCSRERVSWAGTKDKHAVTTQLFSVYGADPGALPEVDGADIDVVGRAGRSLEFGDLAGNEFTVRIGDPDRPANAAAITDELRAFAGVGDGQSAEAKGSDGQSAEAEGRDGRSAEAEGGDGRPVEDGDDQTTETGAEVPTVAVPNYFGQQRFGSRRPITHEVGLAIVRGDWEGAVMAYLGTPNEAEPEDTRSARTFVEETREWATALERFPNRLRYERSMLHELAESESEPNADAFRAALERLPSNLQRLFVHAAQSYAFNRMLSERLDRGLPFHEPVEGDVVCFADRDAPGDLTVPDTDRLQSVTERRLRSVRRHCQRGRAFVTAPLVGTETEFAGGVQGEIERDVLADLELARPDFELPGEFGSTGTRRAILVRTDVDVDDETEGGPLAVSFTLPKGSYATVLLREYCKVDPIELG